MQGRGKDAELDWRFPSLILGNISRMESKASTVNLPPGTGRRRSHFFLWVVGLALVLGFLLHESLLGGEGLGPADGLLSFPPWQDLKGPGNPLLDDQFLVFIPQHEFVYQQFRAGHFPFWNPFIDCGVPNLGSFQGALLFPINLLLLPVPPFYAASIAAWLKLFLAGCFTMLYLRTLGVSNSGAFLAGLVFSLSGFMIVWLGHPHVNSAMWLPLMLYLTERFFQCVHGGLPVIRVGLGFALVVGCMLLGGHPPTMVHLVIFQSVYFLFRWIGHRRECPLPMTGWWLGAFLVGCLLAAPAILPFLEYDHYSAESSSSIGMQRAAMKLPLNSLIFYLLPHLSGSPADGWEDTLLRLGVGNLLPNYNERTGYVGVLPLLFALYAVSMRRCALTWFHAGVILVCFLFICGLPPLPAMLGALPVLHAINPMRLLLVAGFSIAVLAGMGWDQFQRLESTRWKGWIGAGFWAVVGIVLLSYGLKVAPRWHTLEAGCRAYLLPQFQMLAGSLLVSAALFLRAVNQRRGFSTALALGWVTMDLLAFARGYNPQIPHDRYYPTIPAIEWLKQDPGHYRILGDQAVLKPNVAEVFGLRDARGCDFTTVRRYEELITGRSGDFYFYTTSRSVPKSMPLLGVKYWLAFQVPNPDPAQYELVYSNLISIFRYRPVRERALAVYDYRVEHDPAAVLNEVRSGTFDPQRTLLLEDDPPATKTVGGDAPLAASANTPVRFVSDQADTVTVEATLAKPGFLLLLDTYFPGWTATVNGQPARIYRADYNFRAVQLPAGPSTVYFAYRPASFRVGLMLAAIGWLILGTGFCRSGNQGKGPDLLSK